MIELRNALIKASVQECARKLAQELEQTETPLRRRKMDYIALGPTPSDEDCIQVGAEDYGPKSMRECQAWQNQLERVFPNLPDGCSFSVKSFLHDFGSYREVVLRFDETKPNCLTCISHIDSNLPTSWDEIAKQELGMKPKVPPLTCESCGSPAIVTKLGVPMCEECALLAEDSGF
jgi:hypothetical protein